MENPFPWNPDAPECDEFEELAAKMEYDGGLSRERAEQEAADFLGIARQMVSEVKSTPKEQKRSKWRDCVYDWPDLASMDTSIIPSMLWDGFLPTDDIAILAGLKGRGKSTLVLQLAVAIVRGDSTFLGRTLNITHKRVLYVKFEGSGKTRLARAMKKHGVASPGLRFLAASRLSSSEIIEAMIKLNDEMPFDMIVIDCLGNAFTGEQNSNSDAQKFFRQFEALTSKTLLLFIHHLNKAANNNTPHDKYIQGAGGFVQRARTVLMFSEEGGDGRFLHVAFEDDMSDEFRRKALILQFDKARKEYSTIGQTRPVDEINAPSPDEKPKPRRMDLREALSARALETPGQQYNRTQLAKIADIRDPNSSTMHRILKRGEKEGWLKNPGHGLYEFVVVDSMLTGRQDDTESVENGEFETSIHPPP